MWKLIGYYLFLFWNLVLDEEKAFWPFATNFQFWNVDLKYLSQQTNKLFNSNNKILLTIAIAFEIQNGKYMVIDLEAMHTIYSSYFWQLTRMVDSTSIDKNGWFWYFYRQDLLILTKQRINILDDACYFGTTSSHFGDEKQQNGSPNQQNVNPYQQSGTQKREISCYISTSGV